jgi:glucosamine-6-phosphate deaminase
MSAPATESQQREKIAVEIFATADDACRLLAREIADTIRLNEAAGRPTVLGLATGSTPVRLYRELARLHREEKLSFKTVLTFNLDEYYGLSPVHPESYRRFMDEQLFRHIDILPENTHVPDGTVPRGEAFHWCQVYEERICAAGGLDLQLLGIGRTGHIGFNEPGSTSESRTRLVTLDSLTRRDAARDFRGEANVPRHAITMGIGTILEARKIVLLAWGEAKAGVVARAVEEPPTDALPASFLQRHADVRMLVDEAAASQLTRLRHPWLVGAVTWTPALIRRAVTWLALHLQKPVLKLLDEDYGEHGMAELLTEHGPAYELNIRIFNELQHTITGWPGGKPDTDDRHRPERAKPHPKRVLIFSPEPSDDMLGMGATLRRLVNQKHHVTVAYQTSGNLGVPDEEAAIVIDLMLDWSATDPHGDKSEHALTHKVRRQFDAKQPFDTDTTEIRRLKGLLRRAEARASLKSSGVEATGARFLELPFYERGRYRQFQIGEADVTAVVALLREVKPHQVFATGNAADPNSVSAVCFDLLRRALAQTSGEPWRADCRVWLYRSPDHEWAPAEIDMAVPLSPQELAQKIQAIYHHKSQRSQRPMAPDGTGETWQQADRRNRSLARFYDSLGLADYEAIEAFERMDLL